MNRAFRNRNRSVAWVLALALGAMLSPAAARPTIEDVLSQDVARFTRLLSSPLPHQRLEAVKALSHMKHWPAEPLLIERLQDPEPDVRLAALQALARLGTAPSVPVLITQLEHGSWTIRQEAWLALCRMTGQRFPAEDPDAWSTWWKTGTDQTRQATLLAAARGQGSSALPRPAALRALRHLALPEAEPDFLQWLQQPAQPPLTPEERVFLAEILERIGTAQSVPVLAGQRSDAAAWALGRIGGPEALEALTKFRPTLPVLLALDRIGFTNSGPSIPFLVDQMGLITYRSQPDDVMNRDDQPIQRVGVNLIRRSGQAPRLIELILQELEDSMNPPLPHGPRPPAPPPWETMLQQMREELKPGFVRNDGRTTSQPLTALSLLADDPALAPRLRPLLRHPAYVARVYVGLTLGRLRATEASPAILEIIREGYPFSDATALASGKHFDQSQSVRWRGFLCMALGRMGSAEARQALETLAADPAQPRDIRYGAVVGLSFILSPQSLPALHEVAARDIIWMVRTEARQVAQEIEALSE